MKVLAFQPKQLANETKRLAKEAVARFRANRSSKLTVEDGKVYSSEGVTLSTRAMMQRLLDKK